MVRILFLCTGNACRSQMAEGWARRLKRGSIEAFSAEIDVIDLTFSHKPLEMLQTRISAGGYDIVGVSVMTPMLKEAIYASQVAREAPGLRRMVYVSSVTTIGIPAAEDGRPAPHSRPAHRLRSPCSSR